MIYNNTRFAGPLESSPTHLKWEVRQCKTIPDSNIIRFPHQLGVRFNVTNDIYVGVDIS